MKNIPSLRPALGDPNRMNKLLGHVNNFLTTLTTPSDSGVNNGFKPAEIRAAINIMSSILEHWYPERPNGNYMPILPQKHESSSKQFDSFSIWTKPQPRQDKVNKTKEKRPLTESDFPIICAVLNCITMVKDYAYKVAMYDKLGADMQYKQEEIALPDTKDYLKAYCPEVLRADSLDELYFALEQYLNAIPQEVKSHLDKYQTEDYFAKKYYNEIRLYQAQLFVDIFNYLLYTTYMIGPCTVDIYNLNDEVTLPFQTKEMAERFISFYGQPANLIL